MAKYHHSLIEQLSHQLKLSPVRLRLKQLDAAEYLIDLLEPDKHYPYDFVCHHITGYRSKKASPNRGMSGKTLIEDLSQLVEDLSSATILPVGALKSQCWTTEQLAKRLKVSTKTICRWRRRGLPGRKLRYPDGTVRTAYLERGVRRFVTKFQDLVRRGAAFKQLSESEKQQIVDLARVALKKRRMRLHELAQHIATEIGRAVETVRYTLRRFDEEHSGQALFGQDDQPVIKPELQAIFDAVHAGGTPAKVGRKFGCTAQAVKSVVREVRARLLVAQELQYIHNPEFELPGADDLILAEADNFEGTPKEGSALPRDLPPYLQNLYRQPLLTPEQERNIFRRYNYLKFKADRLRTKLDVFGVSEKMLDQIEGLITGAEQVKNQILKANLRLVVSIARRHVGRSPHFFEIVSDGNLSLMRAVEKFDYARGFKFSTYASWAIMRNYARTIPEEMYASARMVTGSEELLAATPAKNENARESVVEAAKHLVARGLDLLTSRERDVLVWHYGLEKNRTPMTLDQIGRVFDVTKERVRQIERKAFDKLRDAFGGESDTITAGTAG